MTKMSAAENVYFHQGGKLFRTNYPKKLWIGVFLPSN